MAAFFLDSSAIAKRYVDERGSDWIAGLLDPSAGHRIHVVSTTGVEVVAALARRLRHLGPGGDFASVIAEFRDDYANAFWISDTDEHLVELATELAEKHALRGYDALQLAAAMDLNEVYRNEGELLTLISADAELNAAAAAEGLLVDDPNLHP